MDHLDFEVEIGPDEGGDRTYRVSVLRSPAGEGDAMMQFPFDDLTLENRLLGLQNALLSSGVRRRRIAPQVEQPVIDLGATLFDSLFAGEVRDLFDVSRRQAHAQGLGLRVKLRCEPPELATLPWEFLYDRDNDQYISLSTDTPIVRYLSLPKAIEPLRVTPPLRVLGMIASPSDLDPLDVARERDRIEQALAAVRHQGRLELHWVETASWRALQHELQTGAWNVFHFIGHGGFDANLGEGIVAFVHENGTAHRLPATELGILLGDHRPLRLAFLNSCDGAEASRADVFSSTAAVLVRRETPAVVAMQYPISDQAAIELSRSFYEAIANGYPVDAALAEARKAVRIGLEGSLEWGTPVLFMRAPDGVLFDIDPARAAPTPTPTPATPTPEPPQPHSGVPPWVKVALPVAAAIVLIALLARWWVDRDDGTTVDAQPTAQVDVPDVRGRSIDDVCEFLMGNDLSCLLQSTGTIGTAAPVVLHQDPQAGASVDSGTEVVVFFDEAPSADAQVLSVTGVGQLVLGMGEAEAESTGMLVEIQEHCNEGETVGTLKTPLGGIVVFREGRLATISIVHGATTAEGVGLGSDQTEFQAVMLSQGYDVELDDTTFSEVTVIKVTRDGTRLYEALVNPAIGTVKEITAPFVPTCPTRPPRTIPPIFTTTIPVQRTFPPFTTAP